MQSKKIVFEISKKCVIIVVGSVIAAFGLSGFLIPNMIAAGGVGGIATILHYLFNAPLGMAILTINIPLFLLGIMHFGKTFGWASIVGTVALSVFADIFLLLPPITDDLLLAGIFGGVLTGIGFGIVLKAGATTGGSDIIAMLLNKVFPKITIGQLLLVVDLAIVTAAGMTFKRWEITLYSAIVLYISTYVVDAIIEGVDFSKMAFIISDKSDEISSCVLNGLERGVTALSGQGMFTGNEKKILMCVLKRYEISELKKIVKNVDKDAFVVLTDVREVLGQGFKVE